MRKTNLRGGSHAKTNWQRMPLSKCIISLVLTVMLVFGIGPKLSYAADVLPDGPQTVTMTNAETKTLVAPSNSFDQATYAWEMFSTELNDFALISGETGSTLKVDPGYFGEDATSVQIRCTVSDENSDASTSQIYNVNLTRENNFAGASALGANLSEEGATTESIQYGEATANDVETNAEYAIEVKYVNKNSEKLANPTKVNFTENTPFSWKLQVKNFLGAPDSYTIDPETGSGITTVALDKTGITIKSETGITAAVTVTVMFDLAEASYTVDCYDQLVDGTYPAVPSRNFTKTGTIGTDVPATEEEAKSYILDEKGWGLAKSLPTTITFDGSSHCSIGFYRTFSLVSFDCAGGKHGPDAIFARYGTTYEKPATPDKAGYDFKGWKDPSGQMLKNYVVPAENTTYTAVWEASSITTANVYLVYWGEDANYTGDATYSYLTESRDTAKIGTTYVLPKNRYNPGVTDTQKAEYQLKYKVTNIADIKYDQKTVTADGYTIVNIYLQRTKFQWDFRSNDGDSLIGSIIARWDENIHSQFTAINKLAYPSATDWDSAPWIVTSSGGNTTYVNLLTNMSTVNHTLTGYWYSENSAFRKVSSRFNHKVYFNYFLQKIDGDYSSHGSVKVTDPTRTETNFENWKKVLMDDYNEDEWGFYSYMNFTEDEWIPIEGFTAPSYYDKVNSPTTGVHVGWTGSDNKRHGYGIFYKRNQHDISLNRITGVSEEWPYSALLADVYYEKTIGDVEIPTALQKKGSKINPAGDWILSNFRPNNPGGAIDKNLVFAGFTYDQDGQGEVIDLTKDTMPNAGINLYAKWVDPKITVNFIAPMDPTKNEPTESADIDPAYSKKVENVVYNTKLNEVDIPEIKVFKDADGNITYDGIARYYYEDPVKKTGKTYWNPHDMVAPGHDITVYTEYENVKTVDFTVKYQLADGTPVAADRTEIGYVGDTVTVIAKQQNELYFDYRAMYVPDKPQQNVTVQEETPTVIFTYSKDTKIKLRYNVYHVIKDLLPDGWKEGDPVEGKALIKHEFVQDVNVNTIEVNALPEADNPYTVLRSDCPTIQTIVLSNNSDNNAYFYYDEKFVAIQYVMKIDGTEKIKSEWPEGYKLSSTTQEVKVLSGTATCTLTVPGGTMQYSFANWTKESSTAPVSENMKLEVAAGDEPWTNTTFYANLYTSKIKLNIVSESADKGKIVPAQPAEGWDVPTGTAYKIENDTITFSFRTTTDSCKAVGNQKELSKYEFSYWTINSDPTQVTGKSGVMSEDTTFTAHFVIPSYTVSFHVKDNIGGKVSMESMPASYGLEYSVDDNNNLVFGGDLPVKPTADKDNHYHFVKWTLENGTDPVTSGTISTNADFYAWFELDLLNFTFASSGHGNYEIEGQASASSIVAPYGTKYAVTKEGEGLGKLTFTLPSGRSSIESLPVVNIKNVDEGYKFASWSTNPAVVEGAAITKNEIFTCNFEIQTFNITFTWTPQNGGTVKADQTVFSKIPYGTAYEVTNKTMLVFNPTGSQTTYYASAVPNTAAHYEFVKWDLGGSEVTPHTVTSDLTFNATFELVKHTITFVASPSDLGNVQSSSITSHYGSKWAIDSSNKNKINVTDAVQSIPVKSTTATAVEHAEFVNWFIKDSDVPVSGTQTLEADITVVAKFKYVDVQITLASADASKGRIGHSQGIEDSHTYTVPYNTTFKISTATGYVQFADAAQQWSSPSPFEHYTYSFWSDKQDSSGTPLLEETNITVTGSETYYCHFKRVEYPVIFVNVYKGVDGQDRGTIKDSSGNETTEIWVPYGTDYLITEDSRTGINKEWGKISFSYPDDEFNDSNDDPDEVITATRQNAGGYQFFWDGWYATWVDKELETGEIVQQRVFNAVFWQAYDKDYGVAHMQQTIDPETGQVVEVASKEEAYQKWFMKDSQYNKTTTAASDVTIPLNDYNYYNCIDTPVTLHFTTESPAHQLVVYRYERQKFDVNITYVIEGQQNVVAPDPVEDVHAWGETYNYVSPVVEGYTPDIAVVEGEMPTEDLNVVVTYTKNTDPTPGDNPTAQTGDDLMPIVAGIIAVIALAGLGIFLGLRRKNSVRGKHSTK